MLGCLMVLIPVGIVGTMVVSEASQAYNALVSGASATSAEQVATSVGAWLEPSIPGASTYAHTISQELNTYVTQSLEWLVSHVGSAFTGILGIFLRTLIFMMALYYFLKEGSRLEKLIIKKSPLHDDDGATILNQLSRTISSVVKGSLAIACIQSTAGVDSRLWRTNAALWGVTPRSPPIPGGHVARSWSCDCVPLLQAVCGRQSVFSSGPYSQLDSLITPSAPPHGQGRAVAPTRDSSIRTRWRGALRTSGNIPRSSYYQLPLCGVHRL